MMMQLYSATHNCPKTQESLILEHNCNISLIDQNDFRTFTFAVWLKHSYVQWEIVIFILFQVMKLTEKRAILLRSLE